MTTEGYNAINRYLNEKNINENFDTEYNIASLSKINMNTNEDSVKIKIKEVKQPKT